MCSSIGIRQTPSGLAVGWSGQSTFFAAIPSGPQPSVQTDDSDPVPRRRGMCGRTQPIGAGLVLVVIERPAEHERGLHPDGRHVPVDAELGPRRREVVGPRVGVEAVPRGVRRAGAGAPRVP